MYCSDHLVLFGEGLSDDEDDEDDEDDASDLTDYWRYSIDGPLMD